MSSKELYDIFCLIVGETDKAYRIEHGGEEPCWIPKDQVEFYPDEGSSTKGQLTLPMWLAIEKGIV